jgi:hypothetical protein
LQDVFSVGLISDAPADETQKLAPFPLDHLADAPVLFVPALDAIRCDAQDVLHLSL